MSNAKATRVLTKALSLVTRQQAALAKSSDAIKKALTSAQALTSADGDAKPARAAKAAKPARAAKAAKPAAKKVAAKKVAAKVAPKAAKATTKPAAKPAKATKVVAKPAKAAKKSRITEDDFPEE